MSTRQLRTRIKEGEELLKNLVGPIDFDTEEGAENLSRLILEITKKCVRLYYQQTNIVRNFCLNIRAYKKEVIKEQNLTEIFTSKQLGQFLIHSLPDSETPIVCWYFIFT